MSFYFSFAWSSLQQVFFYSSIKTNLEALTNSSFRLRSVPVSLHRVHGDSPTTVHVCNTTLQATPLEKGNLCRIGLHEDKNLVGFRKSELQIGDAGIAERVTLLTPGYVTSPLQTWCSKGSQPVFSHQAGTPWVFGPKLLTIIKSKETTSMPQQLPRSCPFLPSQNEPVVCGSSVKELLPS